MKAQSSRTKTWSCAYCGKQGPVSRDHVPPKALFGKPRPADLITVPACEACHSGTSKDDEYFRAILLSSELVAGHPEAQKAEEVLLRGLERPDHTGLLKDLNRSIGEVEVWSPEGSIYLGNKPGIQFDTDRIRQVITRIIRGLFFHERGYPVPDEYGVMAQLQPNVRSRLRDIIASIAFEPEKVIARGAFQYFFQGIPDEPDTTMWVLHFYGNFPAIGFTSAAEHLGPERISRFQWLSSEVKETRGEDVGS